MTNLTQKLKQGDKKKHKHKFKYNKTQIQNLLVEKHLYILNSCQPQSTLLPLENIKSCKLNI